MAHVGCENIGGNFPLNGVPSVNQAENGNDTPVGTMQLSEIYVHKTKRARHEESPSADEDIFQIFHIFELSDKPNSIKPRLSTNCTDPEKIIDAIENSPDADSPVTQQLIKKLRSKDNLKIETTKINTNGVRTSTVVSNSKFQKIASKPNDVQLPTRQIEATGTATPSISTIASNVNVSTSVTAKQHLITNVENIASANDLNRPGPAPVLPTVVHTTTNNQLPIDNNMNNGNGIPLQTNRPVVLNDLMPMNNNGNLDGNAYKIVVVDNENSDNVVFSLAEKSDDQPTLRIDKVFQAVDQNFVEDLITNKPDKAPNVSIAPDPQQTIQNYQRTSDGIQMKKITVRRLETLQDKIINRAAASSANAVASPSVSANQLRLPAGITVRKPPVLTTPTARKATNQPLHRGPVPVNAISVKRHSIPVNQNTLGGDQVNLVRSEPTQECLDFRCNHCLQYNENLMQLKSHMARIHDETFLCDTCHRSFKLFDSYQSHQNVKCCAAAANSSRKYTSLIDPPIILMKNNVRAYKCKHCHFAFYHQKNYCHHAQKHATHFRCKICTHSKPMLAAEMCTHLRMHQIKTY